MNDDPKKHKNYPQLLRDVAEHIKEGEKECARVGQYESAQNLREMAQDYIEAARYIEQLEED